MVQITLPKNSKITEGKTWPKPQARRTEITASVSSSCTGGLHARLTQRRERCRVTDLVWRGALADGSWLRVVFGPLRAAGGRCGRPDASMIGVALLSISPLMFPVSHSLPYADTHALYHRRHGTARDLPRRGHPRLRDGRPGDPGGAQLHPEPFALRSKQGDHRSHRVREEQRAWRRLARKVESNTAEPVEPTFAQQQSSEMAQAIATMLSMISAV